MQLIVDSGASHSTWVYVQNGSIIDKQVLFGMNVTTNPDSLSTLDQLNSDNNSKVEEIYFYGSGVSNQNKVDLLKDAFLKLFSSADKLFVTNDILGACRAIGSPETSIVSILGTGVNTVLFEGTEIISRIKSLGYVLAEEGSGFNLGRLVAKAYLRGKMSPADSQKFKETYLPMNLDLIEIIYNNPKPNFFVASMSKFLNICSTELHEEITNQNFKSYFENHILPIPNYSNYKINLVGSIAFHFEKEIRAMAHHYNMEVDAILKDPIEGLVKYHSK